MKDYYFILVNESNYCRFCELFNEYLYLYFINVLIILFMYKCVCVCILFYCLVGFGFGIKGLNLCKF